VLRVHPRDDPWELVSSNRTRGTEAHTITATNVGIIDIGTLPDKSSDNWNPGESRTARRERGAAATAHHRCLKCSVAARTLYFMIRFMIRHF